jgi:hypothetical protein
MYVHWRIYIFLSLFLLGYNMHGWLMEIIVSTKQQNMTQKYDQFSFRNSSLLTVHQLGVRGLRSLHLKGYNIVTLTDKQTWHNWCVNWHQYNNIIDFPMLLATFLFKKENSRLWNHTLSVFMSFYPFPTVSNNNMADARIWVAERNRRFAVRSHDVQQ